MKLCILQFRRFVAWVVSYSSSHVAAFVPMDVCTSYVELLWTSFVSTATLLSRQQWLMVQEIGSVLGVQAVDLLSVP